MRVGGFAAANRAVDKRDIGGMQREALRNVMEWVGEGS